MGDDGSLSRHAAAAAGLSRFGRLWVRLHAHRLDRRLAAGADPADDPELARRAKELAAPKGRSRIAAVLDRVRAEAEGPSPPFASAAPFAREAIGGCAEEIEAVVDRLEGDDPVGPRGVAHVAVLVHDRTSPLYSPDTAEPELRRTFASVLAELDAR